MGLTKLKLPAFDLVVVGTVAVLWAAVSAPLAWWVLFSALVLAGAIGFALIRPGNLEQHWRENRVATLLLIGAIACMLVRLGLWFL